MDNENKKTASTSASTQHRKSFIATVAEQYKAQQSKIRLESSSSNSESLQEESYQMAIWIQRQQYWLQDKHGWIFRAMLQDFCDYFKFNIDGSDQKKCSRYLAFVEFLSDLSSEDFIFAIGSLASEDTAFVLRIMTDIFHEKTISKRFKNLKEKFFGMVATLSTLSGIHNEIELFFNNLFWLFFRALHPLRTVNLPILLIENPNNPQHNLQLIAQNSNTSIFFQQYPLPKVIKCLNAKNKSVANKQQIEISKEHYYRFLNEIFISSLLNNDEYIVNLYAYTPISTLKIHMEYAPYGDLMLAAEKMRFTPIEKIILSAQMMFALIYIHNLGILHRDFKISNILVFEKNGKLYSKVSDFEFGICEEESWQHQDFVGTRRYCAPEIFALSMQNYTSNTSRKFYLDHTNGSNAQRLASVFSRQTDTWAFFCTIVTLITLAEPYEDIFDSNPNKSSAEKFSELCQYIVAEKKTPLSSGVVKPFLNFFPTQFGKLLEKGFEFNPQNRPDLMTDVLPSITKCYDALMKSLDENQKAEIRILTNGL